VHGGIMLPGGQEGLGYMGAMVQPTCGAWVHAINMFVPREAPSAEHIVDTQWQWPLERLRPGQRAGARGGRPQDSQ
jgi:hypothetical protein